MIDVDHFKLYNDTHGRPMDDACLSAFGKGLTWIAAETIGLATRYSGDVPIARLA